MKHNSGPIPVIQLEDSEQDGEELSKKFKSQKVASGSIQVQQVDLDNDK